MIFQSIKKSVMTKIFGLSFLLFFLVMIGVAPQLVAAPQAKAQSSAKSSLNRFFKDVKTYRARFKQVVLDENDTVLNESFGTLWIKRPNKFRWDYRKPYKQEIVGDGKKIWLYDVDLLQVTVKAMAGGERGTPAMLLAGRGRLSRYFSVKELGETDGLDWLQMQPRKKDSGFDDIRLGFKKGKLKALEMTDGFGQTTRITLRSVKENPNIAAEKFVFDPPDGVDIVYQ
jgi:outer membrane lipoprotein carrier protein